MNSAPRGRGAKANTEGFKPARFLARKNGRAGESLTRAPGQGRRNRAAGQGRGGERGLSLHGIAAHPRRSGRKAGAREQTVLGSLS